MVWRQKTIHDDNKSDIITLAIATKSGLVFGLTSLTASYEPTREHTSS